MLSDFTYFRCKKEQTNHLMLDEGMMQIAFEIKDEYRVSCVLNKQETAEKMVENLRFQT